MRDSITEEFKNLTLKLSTRHNKPYLGPPFKVGEKIVLTNAFKAKKGTIREVMKVKGFDIFVEKESESYHQKEHSNY